MQCCCMSSHPLNSVAYSPCHILAHSWRMQRATAVVAAVPVSTTLTQNTPLPHARCTVTASSPTKAFIVCAAAAAPRGAPSIVLPHQEASYVRHIALDIGGSLIKLVYFSPDAADSAEAAGLAGSSAGGQRPGHGHHHKGGAYGVGWGREPLCCRAAATAACVLVVVGAASRAWPQRRCVTCGAG